MGQVCTQNETKDGVYDFYCTSSMSGLPFTPLPPPEPRHYCPIPYFGPLTCFALSIVLLVSEYCIIPASVAPTFNSSRQQLKEMRAALTVRAHKSLSDVLNPEAMFADELLAEHHTSRTALQALAQILRT
jgi:hypothetical protein